MPPAVPSDRPSEHQPEDAERDEEEGRKPAAAAAAARSAARHHQVTAPTLESRMHRAQGNSRGLLGRIGWCLADDVAAPGRRRAARALRRQPGTGRTGCSCASPRAGWRAGRRLVAGGQERGREEGAEDGRPAEHRVRWARPGRGHRAPGRRERRRARAPRKATAAAAPTRAISGSTPGLNGTKTAASRMSGSRIRCGGAAARGPSP